MAMSGVNGAPRKQLQAALLKWRQLPSSVRKPEPISDQEAAEPAMKSNAAPPPEALIIRVYQRNLKRGAKGDYALLTRNDLLDKRVYRDPSWLWANSIYTEPMPDIMWLTAADWKSLVPDRPKKAATFDVPAPVRKRLFRYHLTDGTFGLSAPWKLSDIRREALTLAVEETEPVVRMRLQGYVLLMTDPDPAKAKHCYEATLHGVVTFDPGKQAFTRFDLVAAGDCWGGEGELARFTRAGRAPLGFAFELAQGDRVGDFVPPRGGNFIQNLRHRYFLAEKP